MLRDAAQGRKLLPRQDGSFKGLVNILWLFSFTTTRSRLQEIIPKLGQKIYTRNNADELLDKDSDSNPQRGFCFGFVLCVSWRAARMAKPRSIEQQGAPTISGRLSTSISEKKSSLYCCKYLRVNYMCHTPFFFQLGLKQKRIGCSLAISSHVRKEISNN